MIQAMGGMPPMFRPPQPPLPVFRPGGGGGHHSRIMDFLAGQSLNRNQLARMGNGEAPGGFNGAFSGINPAVLMQLAQMLQQGGGQEAGGHPPVFNPGQPGILPPRTVHAPNGVARGITGQLPPGLGGPMPPRRRMGGKLPLIPLRGLG